MKRKLSALLAIVLVVVMVFPTAIFVGADAPATITATYKDFYGETKTVSDKGTVNVPVGSQITLTISVPDGYSTIKGERYDGIENGAVRFNGSGNSYTFVGTEADKTDKIKFIASGTDKKDLSMTIDVTCVTASIFEKDVSLVGITSNDTSAQYIKANAVFSCKTGTEVSGATFAGTLDNGVAAQFEDIKFSVGDGTPSEKLTITKKDSDKYLTIYYSVKGVGAMTGKTKSVYLNVDGYDIASVVVSAKSNPIPVCEAGKISSAAFAGEYLTVETVDTDNRRGDATGYTVKYYKSGVEFTGEINSDNYEDITFIVTYNKVDSASEKVSDYVSFDKPVVAEIEARLTNPSNNEYIVGTQLTANEVVVYVKYRVGDVVDADWTKVNVKNTKFTKFVMGQQFVYADFYYNGTHYENIRVELGNNITVVADSVDSIVVTGFTDSYKAGETMDLSKLSITVKYKSGTEKKNLKHNSDGVVCTPAHGEKLAEGEDKQFQVSYTENGVTKHYRDTYTVTTSSDITSATLAYSSNGKKQYYVGETFNCSGYLVNITRGGKTTTYELSKLKTSDLPTFASKDVGSNIKFTIDVGVTSSDTKVPLEITGITVKNRSEIESITVDYIGKNTKDSTTGNYKFSLAETPAVEDFEINVLYKDGTKAVRRINASNINLTSTNAKAEEEALKSSGSATLSDEGLTISFTITPNNSSTYSKILENTTSLKIVYTEKATTAINGKYYSDSETVSMPITVTIPACVFGYRPTYSNTAIYEKPCDSFAEALEEVEEYVATATRNGYATITLYQDVELRYQHTANYSFDIDLNGHNLTLSSVGVLRVSSKATNYNNNIYIEIKNESNTDSRICYSKDSDDDIIIKSGDKIIIDKDTDSDIGRYDVTISKTNHGKVTGPDEVTHGHDVQYVITPDEDYKIKSISVKEDKATKKYTEKDGVVTVEDVQGALTITVTFEEKAWDNPFTDVYKSATYYKSIQFVYENGLFSGMSATKFEPDTTMTRAMFVTVLGRLAGVDTSKYTKAPSFTDVSTTDQSISYAIPYIQWATDNGLITGYGNGKFGPKDNITHIQMYVLMQRYASYIEHKNTSAASTSIPANDVSDIPTWAGAKEAVQYAAKSDFLVTSSNRITPNGDAKRSELAMLLEKFCANVLEWEK